MRYVNRRAAVMGTDPASVAVAPEYCRVALTRPVFDTFQYRIPPSLIDAVRPGVRVVVPFGRQVLTGVVWSIEAEVDVARVRDVKEVLDETPLLSEPVIGLCRWISRYYAAPPGIVVRAALPPGLLSDSGARKAPELRRKVIALTERLPTLLSRDEAFGRARRQRDVFEALEGMGGRAEVARLERLLAVSRSVIEGLAEKGLAEIRDEVVRRDPFADIPIEEGSGRHEPSLAQAAVIENLQVMLDSEEPGVALLRGVTGSGKTLVYLELLESALAAGKSAIVLVPEIALTPQTVGRFRARFGDLIAVLHSALSDGERYDEWTALREGDKRIAIGTRSAIFAPVDDLGLIVLDEEHDSSYKQSDTPRYHARAVATMRARAAGALCVLGSATPSLESWSNAVEGRYRLFELHERVTPHALPAVEIVDMRRERELSLERAAGADDGDPEPGPIILSERLSEAVERRLESGEQSILLLNRRGYSTFLQCEACGWVWSCRQCNVSLTFHRSRRRLMCHHCAFEMVVPRTCTECSEEALVFSGLGTEQVERRIGEMFPAARIARMDVDTTGTKWAAPRNPRARGATRSRYPARHADDRQGPGSSGGDPGRNNQRRRRPEPARFSRGRAHVPTSRPGSWAGGAGRTAGRGSRADVQAWTLRRARSARARLRGLRGAGDRGPGRTRLSAPQGAREPSSCRATGRMLSLPKWTELPITCETWSGIVWSKGSTWWDRHPVRSTASAVGGAGTSW